jgi:hypothetical protein
MKGDVVTIGHRDHEGIEYVVHHIDFHAVQVKPKGQPETHGHVLDLADLARCTKTGATCIADVFTAEQARRDAQATARAAATPSAGAVVRLINKCGTYTAGTLMSVEKVNSATISLNRLGGNHDGEFGMRIDPRGVTIINLTDLAALLPKA